MILFFTHSTTNVLQTATTSSKLKKYNSDVDKMQNPACEGPKENSLLDTTFSQFLAPHLQMCKSITKQEVETETLAYQVQLIQPPKKPVLILDIDETLVYNDGKQVLKRPYAEYLFEVLYEVYDIWLWTASDDSYAAFIADFLQVRSKVKVMLGNSWCIQIKGMCVKNTGMFSNLDMAKVAIVDNLLVSFISELSNGIIVGSYHGQEDSELLELTKYLYEISEASDLREKIRESFDYSAYLKYH